MPRHTQKTKKRKILKGTFLTILIVGLLGFLGLSSIFIYYAKDAPDLNNQKLVDNTSTRFFDPNGVLLDEIGAEKRTLLRPSEVPQLLMDAVVSVEDKRFYKHPGIDPIRIASSALGNLKAGTITAGGSTLTQQLIKLSFFSTKKEDQTLRRKAQEAWLALKLEREKSKEEILTLYINKVYMSNGIYGMGTAAEKYFGKEITQLTLPQLALLAGIPNAPSAYDPYLHADKAKERRDIVLFTMYNNQKISKEEYDQAIKTDVKEGLIPLTSVSGNRKYLDNYLTSAIQEVKEKTGRDAFKEGMDIYLNVKLEEQKKLYDVINNDPSVPYPDDKMQSAATLLDPNTGAVIAQIGGRKVPDNVQFGINRATNFGTNGRDAGSTVKPLVDYGPAFEYLNYSTATLINDSPYQYPGTNLDVKNYDNNYYGNITTRFALVDSRNVPAVKTLMAVGVDRSSEFLKGVGIELDKIQGGTAISAPLSTEKLAGAYGAFANKGVYSKPYYVNKVVYQDDTEERFLPESQKAMKESTAYMMIDILKDVIKKGTGMPAAIPNFIQAGKTGTSNYEDKVLGQVKGGYGVVPDVSFVGFNQDYVLSVWSGYDDYFQGIPVQSQYTSALVYKAMMSSLVAKSSNNDWTMPKDLVRVGLELYPKTKQQTYQPPVNQPVQPVAPPEKEEPVESTTTTPSSSEEVVESSSSKEEEKQEEVAPEPEKETSSSQQKDNQEPETSKEPEKESHHEEMIDKHQKNNK